MATVVVDPFGTVWIPISRRDQGWHQAQRFRGDTVLAFIMSLCVAAFFVLALRHPARKFGLVDHPGGRKQHQGSVPLIGGIAIFAGFLAGLALSDLSWRSFAGPLAGAVVLLVCGIYDDMRDMRGLHKLGWQALAATLLVITADYSVITTLGSSFAGAEMSLGVIAVPFTILCVTGFINAVNMMDGIDGLTGGYVLIGLVWLAVLALLGGGSAELGPVAALAGAILGFLAFNFPYRKHRRKVFLGDAGSMVLGYLLAWFAITLTQHTEAAVSPGAVAWLLALPVIDTLSLMIRRMVNGRSPFSADRNHLHHLCLRAGFTHTQTTVLMLGGALLSGGVGFIGASYGLPDAAMILALLPVVIAHQHLVSRSATELRIRRVPGVITKISEPEDLPSKRQRI